MDWEGERAPKINAISMLQRNKNSLKNWLFFKSKSKKIVKKHASKNAFFWACTFQSILGGFGEGFGRGLEGLGLSWATFWRNFLVLVFGMLSKRGVGGSWAGFRLHFQGFGRGLGRISGEFWEGLEVPKLQCSWTAFFDFVFWLLVLLEGFGSKTGCLKIAWDAW